MKSVSTIVFAIATLAGSASFATTYDCEVYKSIWKGVTVLTDKDSRVDQLCGHVVLDSSSIDIDKNTAFIEQCDSLVVSISDEGSLSNLGPDAQLAMVRILKPGKASEWMSRNFLKQATIEGAPLSPTFLLELARDQSNLVQEKNLSYGMACQKKK